MKCRRPAGISFRLLPSFLLLGLLGVAAEGCTTYDAVDPDEGADARTPTNDGRVPTSDVATGDSSRLPDAGGDVDDGGAPDVPRPDAPIDATREVVPPNDVAQRDNAVDALPDASLPDTSVDGTIDATPPTDASDARDAADTGVPPVPDSGPDVSAPDANDGGAPDADATAPPDADAGTTIDAIDSGPTCWGGTPSTHDEDNDGVVDECDNCPAIANANQADVSEVNNGGTADGVGDACDPRPNSGGDALYLFDGLNFTSLPTNWSNVGAGMWDYNGTSVTPTGTSTGQELNRAFPSNLGNYLAETAFTYNALTSNGSASIPFRLDAGRNGWGCGLGTPDGVVGQLLFTQVTAGAASGTAVTAVAPMPTAGSRYRLSAGAFGTNFYCFTNTGVRINATATSTTGDSGIRASGVRATFEYLLIYRLGGTIP